MRVKGGKLRMRDGKICGHAISHCFKRTEITDCGNAKVSIYFFAGRGSGGCGSSKKLLTHGQPESFVAIDRYQSECSHLRQPCLRFCQTRIVKLSSTFFRVVDVLTAGGLRAEVSKRFCPSSKIVRRQI